MSWVAYKERTQSCFSDNSGLEVILTMWVAGVYSKKKRNACTMYNCFPAIVKVVHLLFVNSVISITTSSVCFSVGSSA